jgi:hypothetical protein
VIVPLVTVVNVNVVGVGVPVMVQVPLSAVYPAGPEVRATVADCPIAKPCTPMVVTVAVVKVLATFETDAVVVAIVIVSFR